MQRFGVRSIALLTASWLIASAEGDDAPVRQPPLDSQTASYRDGYRTAGAFLAWLVDRHDQPIVGQLNARLRKGQCDEGTFRELPGEGLDELWQDFLSEQGRQAPVAMTSIGQEPQGQPSEVERAGQGGTAGPAAQVCEARPDLTRQPTLYMVGYAHLDTQWRWSYPQVIREMLPKTLHDNFRYFESYPHYIFNFSGANRYRMIKEYYPADYAKLKQYVAAGRWFPCGSSMEECDVNATGAESVIRQVLYGNRFFRDEFGKTSAEFMLPDCFGFPASLPSLLGHCGLKGFSTQKLTWGSAVGIPFHVGVWAGLDGTEVLAALDAGDYNGDIKADLSASPDWLKRIQENGQRSGIYADYNYYGVGDEGGAPREESVKWLEKSVAGTGPVRVLSATAEQMFLDIPAQNATRLPRYQGDLLLTEHSAGSITSQAYMKRWNRKNELLADAAERASVFAEWLGGPAYPRRRLNDAWTLVMGGQFHDILPGTSHPKAYEYSWNDEILALNQFAGVLDSAVGAIAAGLDTRAQGVALVVYNPLSIEREDVVEARVAWPGEPPRAVQVLGPEGQEVPSQVVGTGPGTSSILFLARVPSVGFAVYDVRPAETASAAPSPLKVSENELENGRYRVTLDSDGDVAGIFDKAAQRDLLSAPARLAFLHDKPRNWPAWNIDWSDQQKPPQAYVQGPATVRIVEGGPVRVALEVVRESQGSRFVQTISLAAGDAGDRIELANTIDWQSRACCLKAVFPLTVANPKATYNWEVGTIERGNNDPTKYEVPAHQWFDLTDTAGDYGVTVLADCKYGSDKPDDQTLRLTLLRTPGTGREYQDQGTQDWGRHEILYGLAGHMGDWREGRTDWQALRLHQPLIAFQTAAHNGPLGRAGSSLKASSNRVRVMAFKKAEDSDEVIVRLVELDGRPARDVHVSLPTPIAAAREVNGQEQPIAPAQLASGELVTDLAGYRLRAFALKLGAPPAQVPPLEAQAVRLPYDRCVTSGDGQKTTGGFDSDGRCLPAEMLPSEIAYRGFAFKLGPLADGQSNAVTCRGQAVALPTGQFNRLYLLAAAANGDRKAPFSIDGQSVELTIQDWGGYIGQWDNRIWKGEVAEYAFAWPYELVGLRPAYIRPDPVAWFCSHRHAPDGQNEPYAYCYVFAYALGLPPGAKTLTLPTNDRVFILAATVANDPAADTRPAQPLLDELKRDDTPALRTAPAGG
jgi:alpha-mannosidase